MYTHTHTYTYTHNRQGTGCFFSGEHKTQHAPVLYHTRKPFNFEKKVVFFYRSNCRMYNKLACNFTVTICIFHLSHNREVAQ